ncbi:MAG TPA: hypothetical protein VJL87_02270, partial [Bdellovibrionota bacterium]|nr:hypothetical protein [Bdellovibrionota bacterium]
MIFKFAASLKVAVFLLLSLAATLAAATFIESSYTTAVAQKMVYRTTWFSILLLLLGLNIAAAAIIRFPWRKRHIAFLTTHAGLLILLTGSLQTQIQGFEARLILREGEKGSVLATDKKELKILAKDQGFQQSRTIPFFVRPREGKDLVHFAVGERFSAAVDSYLPWAGSEINLVKNPTGKPVLLLDLKGQMGTVQEWLSLEESSKDELNLGPAVISLTTIPDDSSLKSFFTEKIKVNAERKGELIINIKGKVNKIPLPQKFPKELQLGDGTKIQFVRYMPHAIVENNKLVNKSDQPINPAIELVIHIQKFEPEFHTAFSKFPDFPTLHGHKESAAGVSVKFIDPDMTEAARNELAFGVTSDGKLHYRVVHRGNQTKRGVAEVGSQTELGWMGMTFTVKKF